jgi:hypothetical protein
MQKEKWGEVKGELHFIFMDIYITPLLKSLSFVWTTIVMAIPQKMATHKIKYIEMGWTIITSTIMWTASMEDIISTY